MPRKIILTEEMKELAIKYARNGATRKTIANALGMCDRTFYDNLRYKENESFAEAIRVADAYAANSVSQIIMNMIKGEEIEKKVALDAAKYYMDRHGWSSSQKTDDEDEKKDKSINIYVNGVSAQSVQVKEDSEE